MNRTITSVWIVLILLESPSLVSADIVELPLDCAAVYDSNTPAWSTNFDLGVSFTDISHVYVDWSGEITGGLAVDYYEPGDPFPIDVGVYAYISGPPFTRSTVVWGGEATYPDPEAFDQLSEIPSGTTAWSDLVDGQGTIVIDYTELVIPGSYVEHGSVVLDSASLVVDGTVVPEPATFLLLGLGAILLREGRRGNRPGRRGKIHRVGRVRASITVPHRLCKGTAACYSGRPFS